MSPKGAVYMMLAFLVTACGPSNLRADESVEIMAGEIVVKFKENTQLAAIGVLEENIS